MHSFSVKSFGILIGLLFIQYLCTAHALPGYSADYSPSLSIKQSECERLFVRKVQVKPSTFQWRNQTASIREAWLERLKEPDEALLKTQTKAADRSGEWTLLCFNVDLDGKPQKRKNDKEDQLRFVLNNKLTFIVPTSTDAESKTLRDDQLSHSLLLPNTNQSPLLRPVTVHREVITPLRGNPIQFDLSAESTLR